ncbi:recombinase family protein [bacterium]|nr:recombinase family protein [bacterium]
MLQNSFYYGLIRFKEECSQGIHTPLVSKSLFELVQAVINKKGKNYKHKKYIFPFLELATCASCGGAITAEIQKGHHYYRCTKKKGPCSERYIREEVLAAQIQQAIQDVALPGGYYEFIKSEMNNEKESSQQFIAARKGKLMAERKEVQSKLERLLDAHLERIIDQTEFMAKKETLLQVKIGLDEELTRLSTQGPLSWLEPCGVFVEAAQNAGQLAEGGDFKSQKEFLKKIGSNFLLGGRQLTFEYKRPWSFLGGNSFIFKSLGPLSDNYFSQPEAAQAANFFEKRGPITKKCARQDSNLLPQA